MTDAAKIISIRPSDLPKSYSEKLFKTSYYIDGKKNPLSAILIIYDGNGNLYGIANTLEVMKKWTSPCKILKNETRFIEGMLYENEELKKIVTSAKYPIGNGYYFDLKYLASAFEYVNFKNGQLFVQELIDHVKKQIEEPIDFVAVDLPTKNTKSPSPSPVEKKRIMVEYDDIIVFPDGKTMTFGSYEAKKIKI